MHACVVTGLKMTLLLTFFADEATDDSTAVFLDSGSFTGLSPPFSAFIGLILPEIVCRIKKHTRYQTLLHATTRLRLCYNNTVISPHNQP